MAGHHPRGRQGTCTIANLLSAEEVGFCPATSDGLAVCGHGAGRIALVFAESSARPGARSHAAQSLIPLELVCGIYQSPESAARNPTCRRDAGVLLDTTASHAPAPELCRIVESLMPNTHLVVLAALDKGDAVLHSLQAGACGFHLAPFSRESLEVAVRCAAQGLMTLCRAAEQSLFRSLRGGASRVRSACLTTRERQVLLLLSQGLSDKQIGEELGIHSSTAHSHLGSIFRKLHVVSRHEASKMFLDS